MRKITKLLFLAGLCCLTIMIGANMLQINEANAETANAIIGTFKEEYAVGETINLPEFQLSKEYVVNVQMYEGDTLKILESYESSVAIPYTFKKTGTYIFSYTYYADGASMQAHNYTVNVVEKALFDISAFPQIMNVSDKVEFGEVRLWLNGKSKKADIFATKPNGNAFDISNGVFSPSEVGIYNFTLNATMNGQRFSDKFSIEVVADPSKLFTSNTATFISDYSLPTWSEPGNGVLITTTVGSTKVRYNNIIDISKLTSDIPVIEFQVLYGNDQQTGYTFADLGQGWSSIRANMSVRLIDVYDQSKYISMRWRSGEWYEYNNPYDKCFSYVGTAPCTDNVPKWGNGEFYSTFNGIEGKAQNSSSGKLFNFAMDYETNCAYIYSQKIDTGAKMKYLVGQYANTDHYGKQAFDKFTTGEVYLEISFPVETYFIGSDRAGIVVTSIGGNSLSGKMFDGQNGASSNVFTDNVKPNIILDLEEHYQDNMPIGYVGVGYPVPSAYALDTVSGECKVYCGVVETNSKTEYAIRNGKFIPDKAGEYNLTYMTTDAYGNIDSKTLNVLIKDEELPKITFAFEEEVVAKYKFDFVIPKFTVSGGSGNVNYSYKIYYNEKEVTVDKKLTLSELGTLKFVFEATDYLGTEIGNEDNALLLEIVQTDDMFVTFNDYIPKYVKTGTNLILPDTTVISGAETEVVKTVKVNGTTLGADRVYAVSQTAGEFLTVEYISNNGKECKQTFEIEVVANTDDVRYAMISDIQNASLGSGLNGGLIYQVSGDKYIATPNPVSCNGFVLNANFDIKKLTSKTVYFYDCYSANKVLQLRFTANGAKFFMQVNGREEYNVSPSATFADGTANLYLNFDAKTGRISDYNDLSICYISDYLNGDEYEGFQENMAYVAIRFKDAQDMTYNLLRISNQTFGMYSNILAIGPQVAVDGDLISQYIDKGATVVIPRAKGLDLFDGVFEAYVSVIGPDDLYIFQDAKADTERSFIASDAGVYTIIYYSVDAHQGRAELLVEYTVPDYTAPVITVNTSKINIPVGLTFKIPEATVTDNITPVEQVKLYVFVIDENNHYTMVDDEYTIKKAGKYTLVYVAIDSSGNMSRQTVTIIVK